MNYRMQKETRKYLRYSVDLFAETYRNSIIVYENIVCNLTIKFEIRQYSKRQNAQKIRRNLTQIQ